MKTLGGFYNSLREPPIALALAANPLYPSLSPAPSRVHTPGSNSLTAQLIRSA